MSIENKLRDLALLPGPSGYEDCVGKYLYRYYREVADSVQTDAAGNVIARFGCGRENARRGMIFAHMDSLGLIVKRIEHDGFLRVERLGGIPEKALPAVEVQVRTEAGQWIDGVIGSRSHHAEEASSKYTVTPYKELYVDIGADTAEEVRALGIEVGCPIVYRPRWEKLQNGRCYGTALDNRGGCAVIMELARRLKERPCKDFDLYLAATVQEEYNLRGGMVAAQAIRPDFAIALDVVLTGDTPDARQTLPTKVGGGPALGMYNFHGRGTLNGSIPHPKLVELVRSAAQERRIPLQRFAACGMLTDASYVQLTGEGVPVIDLGFPCRYTHTPAEMCSINDLESLADLVETVLHRIPARLDFRRDYT